MNIYRYSRLPFVHEIYKNAAVFTLQAFHINQIEDLIIVF